MPLSWRVKVRQMTQFPDIVTVMLNPALDEMVFLERLGDYGIPSAATGFLGTDKPQLFEEQTYG